MPDDSDRRVEPRTALVGSGSGTTPERIAEIRDRAEALEKIGRREPTRSFAKVMADTGGDEAVRMAVEALVDAAEEDRGTGGVDLQRGIFPTLNLCSKEGITEVPEADIKGVHQEVMESRRRTE